MSKQDPVKGTDEATAVSDPAKASGSAWREELDAILALEAEWKTVQAFVRLQALEECMADSTDVSSKFYVGPL